MMNIKKIQSKGLQETVQAILKKRRHSQNDELEELSKSYLEKFKNKMLKIN